MAKKIKDIILTKKRTKVEFRAADEFLIDMRIFTNGKEFHYCQIILPDLPGRIEGFKKDGFIQLETKKGQIGNAKM